MPNVTGREPALPLDDPLTGNEPELSGARTEAQAAGLMVRKLTPQQVIERGILSSLQFHNYALATVAKGIWFGIVLEDATGDRYLFEGRNEKIGWVTIRYCGWLSTLETEIIAPEVIFNDEGLPERDEPGHVITRAWVNGGRSLNDPEPPREYRRCIQLIHKGVEITP